MNSLIAHRQHSFPRQNDRYDCPGPELYLAIPPRKTLLQHKSQRNSDLDSADKLQLRRFSQASVSWAVPGQNKLEARNADSVRTPFYRARGRSQFFMSFGATE